MWSVTEVTVISDFDRRKMDCSDNYLNVDLSKETEYHQTEDRTVSGLGTI